jgi:hypothetical protein
MKDSSGWRMVSMRLPEEATDVLDALAEHLPGSPRGHQRSRSVALIWALTHMSGTSVLHLGDKAGVDVGRAWSALEDHAATLGIGLE